jgi:hypothetical protein
MGQAGEFVSILVKCEIDRIVAEAAMEGRTLSAPDAAAELLKTYPKCELSEERIADVVMMAAAKAGVAVELGHPDKHADGRAMLAAL